MLERGDQPVALVGIVSKPMQKLRESPFRRVGAPAPLDCRESLLVCDLGDARGLGLRAMVAPEVVVVERDKSLAGRDHARAGRVEGERLDVATVDRRITNG